MRCSTLFPCGCESGLTFPVTQKRAICQPLQLLRPPRRHQPGSWSGNWLSLVSCDFCSSSKALPWFGSFRAIFFWNKLLAASERTPGSHVEFSLQSVPGSQWSFKELMCIDFRFGTFRQPLSSKLCFPSRARCCQLHTLQKKTASCIALGCTWCQSCSVKILIRWKIQNED